MPGHQGLSVGIAGFLLTLSGCDFLPEVEETRLDGCDAPVQVGEWQTIGLEEENIHAVAIDPLRPNVVFVGSAPNPDTGTDGALLKSSDCGETWETLLTGGWFDEVMFDPFSPGVVYLPGARSIDFGSSWEALGPIFYIDPEASLRSFAVDPHHPGVFYAGTGGLHGGDLFRSIDSGATWAKVSDTDGRPYGSIVDVVPNPHDQGTIFVTTPDQIFRSEDDGATWQSILDNVWAFDFLIDLEDANTFYIAGRGSKWADGGVYRSRDGGQSLELMNEGLPSEPWGVQIEQSPLTGELFLVTKEDAMIWRRPQDASSWTRMLTWDPEGINPYSAALEMSPSGKALYFGAVDAGLRRFVFPE